MNVAVLFDAAENGGVETDTLLAGKELYSYALKTFYFHPCIDCIAVMWCGSGNVISTGVYIESWKTEYGVDKPVWIYQRNQNLQQVLGEFEKEEGQHVELYVLHDVRYPFVKADMIYKVIEKAALHGVAVTVGEVRDDLVVCPGGEILGAEDAQYAKYPMAVVAGHGMLDGLPGIAEVLGTCLKCKPHLCICGKGNLFVGDWESLEIAEAVVRMDKMGDLAIGK